MKYRTWPCLRPPKRFFIGTPLIYLTFNIYLVISNWHLTYQSGQQVWWNIEITAHGWLPDTSWEVSLPWIHNYSYGKNNSFFYRIYEMAMSTNYLVAHITKANLNRSFHNYRQEKNFTKMWGIRRSIIKAASNVEIEHLAVILSPTCSHEK